MDIFNSGAYQAFLVVYRIDHRDVPLFALPVLDTQTLAEVFAYYRYLYVDDDAVVNAVRSDDQSLFLVQTPYANITCGAVTYLIDVVVPTDCRWQTIVRHWEDQWVFDHVVATTGAFPENKHRVLVEGEAVRAQIKDVRTQTIKKYLTIFSVIYLLFVFLASWNNRDID